MKYNKTYVKVQLQLAVCIEASATPWWTHVLLGTIRECMKVETLVAERALAFTLLEVLARLATVPEQRNNQVRSAEGCVGVMNKDQLI